LTELIQEKIKWLDYDAYSITYLAFLKKEGLLRF